MTGRRPTSTDDEARFDAELARVARGFATEELPRGILDHSLSPEGGQGVVRARRGLPAYAGIAAVLVLLLATAIALTPGGVPPASPAPSPVATPTTGPAGATASPFGSVTPSGVLRTTAEIRADFERLRYACRVGNELLPTGPSPSAMVKEGAICSPPADAEPFIVAVIVGEARDGRVVEVHVKADVTGEVTDAVRGQIAVPLAKAAAIAASGEGVGDALAAWVLDAVPLLSAQSANSTKLLGFGVKISRDSSGGYQLLLLPS